MSELPEAIAQVADSHAPGERPPFADLLARRSRQRRRRAGLAVLAAGLAVPAVVLPLALAGDDHDPLQVVGPAPDPVAASQLAVGYDPTTYDPARSDPALTACGELPGVTDVLVAESYPPQPTVSFRGTGAQRDAVVSCLEDVPGVTGVRVLDEPGASPTTSPDEPVTSEPASPGLGPATVRLAVPPGPTDTRLSLLVTERACASGQPATGRIVPEVVYGTDAITVTVQVRGLGMAGCPGNPETPYELVLRQPLGGREVVLR